MTGEGSTLPALPPAHPRSTTPGRKVALITGITGQDGSYLTELLISKGYQVHGIIRRSSSFNTYRIEHLYHDRHEDGSLWFFLLTQEKKRENAILKNSHPA